MQRKAAAASRHGQECACTFAKAGWCTCTCSVEIAAGNTPPMLVAGLHNSKHITYGSLDLLQSVDEVHHSIHVGGGARNNSKCIRKLKVCGQVLRCAGCLHPTTAWGFLGLSDLASTLFA